MTKRRTKINSSDAVAPPQPRLLRSRKRECPSDQSALPDNVQVTFPPQDAEGSFTSVATTQPQSPQSPLQELTKVSSPHAGRAKESFFSEQEVKHLVEGERQEEMMVTDTNEDGTNKEEIREQGCSSSASRPCTDQPQVLPQTLQEEGDGSCATGLEEQLDAMENPVHEMKRNQETGPEEPNNGCKGDDKTTKEAVAVLPAKKKRRMGMCVMTEKERSHILQTQKQENGQNGAERVERQICNDKSDQVTEEEIVSSLPSTPLHIQAATITEQSETEMTLHSELCGGYDRAETKIHISLATSDEINTVCDSRNSDGQSFQAKPGFVPAPEQTEDPNSNPTAEKGERLGSQKQQRPKQSTTETGVKTHEKQMEDGPGEVNPDPAIPFLTNLPQNEGSEENHDGSQVSSLQMDSVARIRNGKMESMGGDADDGDEDEERASSTDTCMNELDRSSVELCNTTVTPSGSEGKDTCGPIDKPATRPSPVNTEHCQTADILDSFGPGCLDYVSDSQLNSVVLIDEEVVESDGCLGSSERHEDATHLICGLIRELASINRIVMATHRQLENVRRGSRGTKGLHTQRI